MPGVDGDFRRLIAAEIRPVATARLAARMATRDAAEWLRVFEAHGVPSAPVQAREQWAASDTVVVNRLLRHAHDDAYGDVVVPDVPVELSLTPGSTEPGGRAASGGAGASGRDSGAGVTDTGPATATEATAKRPLDGMLVVDTTKFLAGPFGGLLLEDLGATVVKVEPPGGEDFRAVAAATYSALNRDKAQVVLDLAVPADRARFASLVQRADVLLENMSRAVVDKLRLDLTQLRAANPRLVHCHVDGWGPGPDEGRPAFDPLLQARSGLMAAQGGLATPVIQAMSVHDIGTGTLTALGAVVALYARTRLGVGQEVRTALSRTSIAFQGSEFTTFAGRPAPPVGRIDHVGDDPAHRLYACADGWVAVGATRAATRVALSRLAGAPPDGRADALEPFFATRTLAEVLGVCRAAGVPAAPVLRRGDVYTDADLEENDFFLTVDDDDLGPVRAIRGFADWDGVPPRRTAVMHASGRDTEAVLGPLVGSPPT
jgi:crotonobetainyl-CoA:carnitine CoA-transferase CaiB-like acyl-CoA transferase